MNDFDSKFIYRTRYNARLLKLALLIMNNQESIKMCSLESKRIENILMRIMESSSYNKPEILSDEITTILQDELYKIIDSRWAR